MDAALREIARYYEEKVNEFGPTPWGVDWTCEPTQHLRFIQLLKIAGAQRRYSLNDLGCGYGALLAFARERYAAGAVDYAGVDVAPAMVAHAQHAFMSDPDARFGVGSSLPRVAHYSVASGLFNVQLGVPRTAWRAFVQDVLRELQRASKRGFAVNFVLPPPPGVQPREGLYRTRPRPWVEFCQREFSADVEVVQGYGLREFTLLVRLPSRRPAARHAAPGRAPSFRTAP